MKVSAASVSALFAVTTLVALAGCDGLKPSTTADLSAGKAAVCASPDVAHPVRRLLLWGDQPPRTTKLTVAFSLATMDAFDRTTSTMRCSVNAAASVGDKRVDGRVSFLVQPKAGQEGFVVRLLPTAEERAFESQAVMLTALADVADTAAAPGLKTPSVDERTAQRGDFLDAFDATSRRLFSSSLPLTQVKQWGEAEEACRGSDNPQSATTAAACDRRDAAFSRLHDDGWCYGGGDVTSADAKWHRCGKPQDDLGAETAAQTPENS